MKRWITIILLGLFLIIVIFLVASFSQGRVAFFGKAVNSGVFNSTNSYVFASPLTGRIGGDKIRVTIFALDDQGRGVVNKAAEVNCKEESLCRNSQVTFIPVQPQSDKMGQAIFDLSSPTAGKYELQAKVEGTPIPQTVTVIFQ